ncbi:MAG: radical SAM protein [Candidatus Brocadiae bacterium]|nr:radical SAM protein [Candidatus Brocadiia bacterium]
MVRNTNFKAKQSLSDRKRYCLKDEVRLRKTPQGGAVFLPSQALAIEMDGEAISLLALLNKTKDIFSLRTQLCKVFNHNLTIAEIDRILQHLVELGFVRRLEPMETIKSSPVLPEIEAPECIHIQLTTRCNQNCPSCYLHGENCSELDLLKLLALVDEIAAMGVFQLAIGGGEPFLSPHLIPLVRHARNRGILPNITTNGSLITKDSLNDLAPYVGEIRLSCQDGQNILSLSFRELIRQVKTAGISLGFNLIVTRPFLPKLQDILSKLDVFTPSSLVLLRPKPSPENGEWYAENSLSSKDCKLLAEILASLKIRSLHNLSLDCAFSFLFVHLPEQELLKSGVQGCSAARRFCVVKANGDVYPCSHFSDESFCMGNIMLSSFMEIWQNRKQENIAQISSGSYDRCGKCGHQSVCGGCRAISLYEGGDLYSRDPGCCIV